MAVNALDEKFMKLALGLARRGLGTVAPNPAVGCVLVRDGIIVGRGWTKPGGRPHAETEALLQAGEKARGATAYVTLEPCAHTGKTPPCAGALVDAGISRCVVATTDPDPRVAGQGNEMLGQAGISVDLGLCEAEARKVNAGFLKKVEAGRPLFTLKLATSLDGRIALANGDSKWITGAKARRYGHMLRASHDAILVGRGTVEADNPSLDCRLPGLEGRSPQAIILDSRLATPFDAKLVRPGTLLVHNDEFSCRAVAFHAHGVETLSVMDTRDLVAVAQALAARGLTRVLVEGGGAVHASFLQAGLADRVEYFVAGKAIGGDGLAGVAPLGLATLDLAPHFTLQAIRRLGPDMLATYVKAE